MSNNNKIKSADRRAFFRKVTGAAALMGVASLVNPAKANDHADNHIMRFTGEADDPEEFFKLLRGKHRVVFDVTEPKEIFPFAWPKIFIMTNVASGASDKDCSAVVVLRHNAIAYAMQDSLWAKYKFGDMFKVNDPETKAPAIRNPYWKPKPDDFSVPGLGQVGLGIPELQTMGINFCVCGMALTVFSAVVASQSGGQAADIRKDWVAGLIPGIPVMPSGVWAVGRAQEHDCGYCFV
jgi:intracellular sulfur oxidation DsrE/DsrF family protein